MLKFILKPIAYSSGKVHTKAFKIGQTFKEKEKIREVIANYSVKERRDLHYVKNDKTRVRVKCRGIVPELTGDSNKGRGNLVLSKRHVVHGFVLYLGQMRNNFGLSKHTKILILVCKQGQ